ncbi:MAG TPA: Rdx family protein [Dehalococcoidia bacterium]|nr:Rdx family protein [Dehalococcoidia bacterium]MDP6272921.1 Rdx family protein [Dehalococcoidia bacterium]MDP7160587.1 Rdx family protein [Dehalococcoidia bacterium]MDP7212620.1 Rdx family protein [Dehalococcoidia bacterium]MDP7514825.1 Rdx family protein [Dehalococcoidia bacterium]
MAAWMATEFFEAVGADVAVTVTPGGSGVFKIAFDGEIVFDKAQNDGKFPDLNGNVKALKKLLQEKVAQALVGVAD